MGLFDSDIRKQRGTPIKKWPVHEQGSKTAADARMAAKAFRAQKAEEKEDMAQRAREQKDKQARKAQKARIKAEKRNK